jgi:hypothetical protein
MYDFEILYRYFPEGTENNNENLPRDIESMGRDMNSIERSTAMWTGSVWLRIGANVGCFEYGDELSDSLKCGGFLE